MNPLAPYLIWIKLGLVAILAAGLFAFYLTVRGWHQDSLALGSVRQEMAELVAQQKASMEASQGYQNELAEIRNRPVPSNPVRLCVKRPAVSSTGSGPGSTLPAAGVLQGADGSDYQEGPDIAADLLRLADEADEVSARGRATQSLHIKGPR